jgi:HlyD family secretion protein
MLVPMVESGPTPTGPGVGTAKARWTGLGLWIGAALLAIALVWALLRWWQGPAVPVVAVTRQTLVESVAATGRLQAPARIEVAAELAGTVAQVRVREGQTVAAGDLLMSLQDAEARAALLQAQAAEREAAGRVQQQTGVSAPLARQSVLQAQAAWWAAQREHGRVSELVSQGFFAPQRLDEARRALDVAGSVLASAQLQAQAQEGPGVEVVLAQAKLAQAQANVGLARARLERLYIRSPVPAHVLSREVEPGAMAQPGRVLLVLAEAGPMHIELSIDERHLPMLRLGMPARALADAYPEQPFDVRLCEIAPAIDAERGSIRVRLCLQSAPEFLRPEMTVSAELIGGRREATLVLPTSVVREADKSAPWVLVLRQGRAQRVAVQLGLSGTGGSEILKGLAEGDLVIAPTEGVLVGDRVRPGPRRAAAPTWSVPSFMR